MQRKMVLRFYKMIQSVFSNIFSLLSFKICTNIIVEYTGVCLENFRKGFYNLVTVFMQEKLSISYTYTAYRSKSFHLTSYKKIFYYKSYYQSP